MAIDRGCGNSEAAAEGEANARKGTAVLPHALPAAYGLSFCRISCMLACICCTASDKAFTCSWVAFPCSWIEFTCSWVAFPCSWI